MNGYTLLAPIYQFLSKLVFGNLLLKAQLHFLKEEQPKSTKHFNNILIIGGGNGELLAEILSEFPSCTICYVESSAKMNSLAKNRIPLADMNRVEFFQIDVFHWKNELHFDVVLLPFFLDLFGLEKQHSLLSRVHHWLAPSGKLIVTDFNKSEHRFQKLLIGFMYFVFNSLNAAETNNLPDFNSLLNSKNWKVKRKKFFGKGFYKNLFVSLLIEPTRARK